MNKNDAVETMGKILPDEIPVGTRDDPEEFWTNVGLVLNVDIKNKTQITYFTCSC